MYDSEDIRTLPTSEPLSPCPFCGKEACIYAYFSDDSLRAHVAAHCTVCRAVHGQISWDITNLEPAAIEEALKRMGRDVEKAWNRRAAPEQPKKIKRAEPDGLHWSLDYDTLQRVVEHCREVYGDAHMYMEACESIILTLHDLGYVLLEDKKDTP